MSARSTVHATAHVAVQAAQSTSYDQTEGPPLVEVGLKETFSGDLAGESMVRALQLRRSDGTSSMVSLQRFDGTLGGRRGSFVLQGTEVITGGRIQATWFVVPRSGTHELAGLRGEGGFEGEFGKGSQATLDYWFE